MTQGCEEAEMENEKKWKFPFKSYSVKRIGDPDHLSAKISGKEIITLLQIQVRNPF